MYLHTRQVICELLNYAIEITICIDMQYGKSNSKGVQYMHNE